MARLPAALLAAVALLLAPACTSRTAPPKAKEAEPLVLEPLPEPPALTVVEEALPGSDGKLAVAAFGPRGEVAWGPAIPSITFSKPVMALESVAANRARPAPASIDPAVDGEWRWLGSSSVEFAPARPLPEGTRFTVTVPAGLKALDGSVLAQPFTFSFETRRPVVLSVEPRAGWAWLTPGSRFSLVFDRPVADLERHVTLRAGGEAISLRVAGEYRVADEERAARRAQGGEEAEPSPDDRRTRYELVPGRSLPLAAQVQLALDGALHGKEGSLPTGQARTWSFRTYGPMALDGAQACAGVDRCPYGPLIVRTRNLADPASLRGKLRIEPPVSIDWDRVEVNEPSSWSGEEFQPHFSIPGRFRPGVEYRITVASGVRDAWGQQAAGGTFTVRTSDLEPSMQVARGAALLEASGDGSLPAEVENLDQLEASVWRISAAEAARLLGTPPRPRAEPVTPPGVARTQLVDLGTERNVTKTRPVPIRAILGGPRAALFFARVRAPGVDPAKVPPASVIGQITDLAVHAKLGATRGLVWVTRLSDGKPAGGASIVVHGAKGETIFTGKADAQGLCDLPGMGGKDEWSVNAPGKGWLVAATLGDDTGVTLSNWAGPFGPWAFGVGGDWDGSSPRSLGTVVADRGIYRPGQTVYLKGIARYRRLGSIETPPAGTRMRIKVVGPSGAEVLSRDVTSNAYGTFSTSFELPRDVALGTFAVAATGSAGGGALQYGGSFRVEEYRAPQFRVDVTTAERSLVAGDPLRGTVLARYLFGGPMADVAVSWSTSGTTLDYQPPGNDGFLFGNQVDFWEDHAPPTARFTSATGKGKTDGKGSFAIDAGKAGAPGSATWEVALEADVADVNRQRVAGRTTIVVHPASLYAGLRRRGSGFAQAGKPLVLELVAVTPAGARQASEVEVALRRREWRSIKKKVIGERWMTVTEPVEEAAGSCRVRTGSDPVTCTFTPSASGLHIAEAVVVDASGRKQSTRASFYVLGDGWVSWNRDDTDRVEMVADREVYDVGETARVLVKSPFPDAEGVLTVEREGVLEKRRVRLGQAAATFDIPIGESSVPNVFASIVIVRGRQPGAPVTLRDDPGRPTVRIGYVPLKVERKSKRLAVDVKVDATEKRPRDKVKVDLQVKDSSGRGVSSEVLLWAVDEGVLRLTGYKLPDLVDVLHPPRGLSVRVAESLVHLVQRKAYGDKGVTTGGSGGLDPSGSALRSVFRTTAVFLPEVVTDASGHAQVEFELPDNLTTFRVMALAVTRGDRVGGGQSSVTVVKPLLALPALPRLARVGDVFEAGVVVHAPGAKVAEVEVQARVEGLVVEGDARRRVALPGGKAREVRFRFRAERPGEAVLRFAVSGGGESDAVEQRIPVVLPVAREAVAVMGETRDVKREALAPPAGARPDVGGLELSLSSTAVSGLRDGMRQLVEYPYGCLEQLSSRLVPFVSLREIQGRFGGSMTPAGGGDAWMAEWVGEEALRALSARDPDEVVKRTVKSIEALQAPDGGYRYWPGSSCSDELASSWAVVALGQAARLGYPVDAARLARGQQYLAGTVAAGVCTQCGWGCNPPALSTRVFAVWALARTGAPRASLHGALYAEREKLPLFAKAMLADAMFLAGGDRGRARGLLEEVLGQARVSEREVHFEDGAGVGARWSSDVRTTAIVLLSLVDVMPDHPYVPRIAAWLTAERGKDGRYRNTQEAAFALSSLARLVATKEREVPDFTARASLGGKTLAEVPFHGRSLAVVKSSTPISELGPPGAPSPLEFRRDGRSGILHYEALLRWAPARMPVDPVDRGIFVQRWFEPWDGGGQARAVRAGDLVRVKVRVGTPRNREDVAVEVALPAGLEIVDGTLATSAAVPGGEEGTRGAFWSPFNHRERRDDRMVLFADRLPAGIHEATFVARATTPGTWVLQPAQAEGMYAPEVFGRSDGGTFRVLDPEAPAGR